jgi:hypothetical protein
LVFRLSADADDDAGSDADRGTLAEVAAGTFLTESALALPVFVFIELGPSLSLEPSTATLGLALTATLA